jgi:hypothetical protein
MIEGEIAHSCEHGEGPHRIKVCIVQKDNTPAVFRRLEARASWEKRLKQCPFLVERSEARAQREAEFRDWLGSRTGDSAYLQVKLDGEADQWWFSDPRVAHAFAETFGLHLRNHQTQSKQSETAYRIVEEGVLSS